MSLPQPPHPEYASGNYIPTWATVAEERFGGDGDIWVADGYGSHLVHRFDRSGNYLQTLDGSEGGGRFSCPHGLALDTRRSEAEFYIADRGNSRFQVYGMDGTYRRSFGSAFNLEPIAIKGGPTTASGSKRANSTARTPQLLTRTGISISSNGSPEAASPNWSGWQNNRRDGSINLRLVAVSR